MSHSQKIISKMSKKAMRSDKPGNQIKSGDFKQQYEIIRKDIMKLKKDLQKGYDMAKGVVEKKGFLNQFIKTK